MREKEGLGPPPGLLVLEGQQLRVFPLDPIDGGMINTRQVIIFEEAP